MLASPGRSPRHLAPLVEEREEKNHGGQATQSDGVAATAKATTLSLMGPPPARKPRKPVVLEEDEYVAAIERIVERDYFPDIPKLKNRLEWMEAIRTRDPSIIRETQMRIIQRKAEAVQNGATPSVRGTPGTGFRTPQSIAGGFSPSFSLRSHDLSVLEQAGALNPEKPHIDTSVSLDTFLRKYTSEDNASFAEIKVKDDAAQRARMAKRLAADQITNHEQLLTDSANLSASDRKIDGFGSTGQPVDTLISWKYEAKNQLMYDSSNRPVVPLTQQEMDERAKGPPKEVVKRNTRFIGKVFDGNQDAGEETVSILYTPIQANTPGAVVGRGPQGKQNYDLEDMKKGQEGAGAGYDFVRTPSPAPGVDASPFVTWGEIEGTPVRLGGEETPLGIGGTGEGPRFKMQDLSRRDETAQAMSRNATKGIRDRQRVQGRLSSPSPFLTAGSPRTTLGSPSLAGLSGAAQKLVSRAMKRKHGDVDQGLRASYGGLTPGRSPFGKLREGSYPLRSPSASPAVRRSSLAK